MPRLMATLLRYAGVSAVSTGFSLTLLALLVSTGSLSPGWANVVATAAGTVPSFELNRRWVWARQGRRSLRREIVPFWTLSFSGLGLSTLAVALTTRWAISEHLGRGSLTMIADGANVTTFGVLWIVQFLLLDRVLFARGQAGRSEGRRTGAVPGAAVSVGPALVAAREEPRAA